MILFFGDVEGVVCAEAEQELSFQELEGYSVFFCVSLELILIIIKKEKQ